MVHPSPQTLHTRTDTVWIIVHSAPKHVSRMIGVAETWGQHVQTTYVLPKVCEDYDPPGMKRTHDLLAKYSYLQMDVRLLSDIPKCYEYPPINVWLHSLLMVKDEVFKWLLKCDDDVYLNVDRLREFLHKVENAECRGVPCYFGALGSGRPLEKHLLGLNGQLFVMGGPCVVMSRLAYDKVLPFLPTCMLEFVQRAHSDTMLGRCFQKANITAGLPQSSGGQLNTLFKQYYPQEGVHDGNESLPFSSTTVPRLLHPLDHTRISLHTIKTREEMHNVHAQLLWGTKPLFSRERKEVRGCTYNQAVAKSLVTFPGAFPLGVDASKYHRVRRRKQLPTCNLTSSASMFVVDMVYVLSLDASKSEVQSLLRDLSHTFPNVLSWPAVNGRKKEYQGSKLTPGENGIKESYSQIFRDALARGFQHIVVFEDDALPSLNFSSWWKNFLQGSCSAFLHKNDSPPWTVLLGATVHAHKTWEAILEQVQEDQFYNTIGNISCFDVPPRTYGAFAILYDTRLIPVILSWLEAYDEPFDWVWSFLSAQGFIVKSVAPFLVIAELQKPSLVANRSTMSLTDRHLLHRWNTKAHMSFT